MQKSAPTRNLLTSKLLIVWSFVSWWYLFNRLVGWVVWVAWLLSVSFLFRTSGNHTAKQARLEMPRIALFNNNSVAISSWKAIWNFSKFNQFWNSGRWWLPLEWLALGWVKMKQVYASRDLWWWIIIAQIEQIIGGVLSTQTSGGLRGLTTQQEESQFFRSLIISRVCASFLELLWSKCDNYERARSAHQLMFSQSGCLAVSHGELSQPPLRKLFATHKFLIAPILMTYL